MVVRLLTVRAVQQVLVQLQEFNQLQAQWLNHFAAENQPQQGNEVRTARPCCSSQGAVLLR